MIIKETTNDPQDAVKAGSIKYDAGKVPIFRGAIAYFPDAIKGVASVSAFGASKYAWEGWRGVPDGINRYTDALVRHLLAEAKGEALDPDSRLPHHWHVSWNSLARSELLIMEAVKKNA